MCGVFKSMETNCWVDLPLKEEVIPPYYKKIDLEKVLTSSLFFIPKPTAIGYLVILFKFFIWLPSF